MTEKELNEKIIMLNSLIGWAREMPKMSIDKIVMGAEIFSALQMRFVRVISREEPKEKIIFMGYPVMIDHEDTRTIRLTFEEWKC